MRTGRRTTSSGRLGIFAMLAGIAAFALVVTVPPSSPAWGQGAGAEVAEPPVPGGTDVFDLNLGQTKAFSVSLNFEVVGHSYLKGSWLTDAAHANGVGAGINSVRVYDGIAYLGGYNGPPTMFGALMVDVSNPKNMNPLSFVPCKVGTRCPYLRVNPDRKILVFGSGRHNANPDQPPGEELTDSGWSFWDVNDPANPEFLSHFSIQPDGSTHGMEIDDRYLYGCGDTDETVSRDELQIIDYDDPTNPVLVSTLHIQGQHDGEDFAVADQFNPNGAPQVISCHEITIHKDRLYIAYRDAGLVIVDVSDRSEPQIIGRLDYVPPFSGGGNPGGPNLGAAHTSMPIVVDPDEHPDLVVHTDEIFSCPPGFGRIIDVSDMKNPEVIDGLRDPNLQVISSYRIPHVSDVYDFDEEEFVCLAGQQSSHLPWSDQRSPSLFYNAWYDQGVRAWDISNPFLPREVGHYLSPKYASFGRVDRHTRTVFQDTDTNLIYITDGSGGGLTVLDYTGPIPENPPIPGGR